VEPPHCVDVALRRKGDRSIIHFVNRASGIPNQPNNGAIDEIPKVGPIVITMKAAKSPTSVSAAWKAQNQSGSTRAKPSRLPSTHSTFTRRLRCVKMNLKFGS
jgi:hypothetical protein